MKKKTMTTSVHLYIFKNICKNKNKRESFIFYDLNVLIEIHNQYNKGNYFTCNGTIHLKYHLFYVLKITVHLYLILLIMYTFSAFLCPHSLCPAF